MSDIQAYLVNFFSPAVAEISKKALKLEFRNSELCSYLCSCLCNAKRPSYVQLSDRIIEHSKVMANQY